MTIIRPATSSDDPSARIAEQRVREWTIALDAQQRRLQQTTVDEFKETLHPYLAVSREAGAGGAAIARRVGQMLGWEVMHRELLDQMAERYRMPRRMLGQVDEATSNWLLEVFGKWLNPRLVTQSEYIVHLGQIVLLAAQNESAVFVGRGAQFFLPPGRGLTVFLVAPLAQRIDHIRSIQDCSEAEAKRYIRETDKGRRDLIRKHFNKEVGDPHLYDLVINRTHTSIDEAVELIAQQCRCRFSGI